MSFFDAHYYYSNQDQLDAIKETRAKINADPSIDPRYNALCDIAEKQAAAIGRIEKELHALREATRDYYIVIGVEMSASLPRFSPGPTASGSFISDVSMISGSGGQNSVTYKSTFKTQSVY